MPMTSWRVLFAHLFALQYGTSLLQFRAIHDTLAQIISDKEGFAMDLLTIYEQMGLSREV